jgi:hypothetical protein
MNTVSFSFFMTIFFAINTLHNLFIFNCLHINFRSFFAPFGTLRKILSSLLMFLKDKNKKRVVVTTLNNHFTIIDCFDFKVDKISKMRFAPFGTLPHTAIIKN